MGSLNSPVDASKVAYTKIDMKDDIPPARMLLSTEKSSGKEILGMPPSVFAGASYCVASMGMVKYTRGFTVVYEGTACYFLI